MVHAFLRTALSATVLLTFSLFETNAQNTDSLEQVLMSVKGKEKVRVFNQLYITWSKTDPVKASGFNQEAIALAREIGDSLGLAKAINNLGHMYSNHGALDQALEYYLTAEGMFVRLNEQSGMAASRSNIGTIYSYKKDYDKARTYFENSEKIFAAQGDSLRLAGVLNNLGSTWLALSDPAKASGFFERSFRMSESAGVTPADPLINLANVKLIQGDHQTAVEILNSAAQIAQKSDDKEILLSTQLGLGNVWLKAGKLKESEKALLEALNLSRQVEAFVHEPEIFKSLASNYAQQGRMKDAYDAMLSYETTRERYFSDESSRRIAQMEILIDIHEKEKEIEGLRRDEALRKVELQRTQLAITLIIISLLTAALLVNLYIQKRKSRKR